MIWQKEIVFNAIPVGGHVRVEMVVMFQPDRRVPSCDTSLVVRIIDYQIFPRYEIHVISRITDEESIRIWKLCMAKLAVPLSAIPTH
jgi:hypothetical protein